MSKETDSTNTISIDRIYAHIDKHFNLCTNSYYLYYLVLSNCIFIQIAISKQINSFIMDNTKYLYYSMFEIQLRKYFSRKELHLLKTGIYIFVFVLCHLILFWYRFTLFLLFCWIDYSWSHVVSCNIHHIH